MKKNIVLGVDIGGSHITAGLVNMDKKEVVSDSVIRKRVNRYGTEQEILAVWCETMESFLHDTDIEITKIGFAMPGPFDYEKGICLIKGYDKYESLYGINIRRTLADRLNLKPDNILFRNDAEAFLDGEIFCGAAAGFNDAIGITLGTGLGSSLSHNGITRDAELSVLDYQGEKIEEWVSTRGILRIYQQITGKDVENVLEIAKFYDSDEGARETFKIFAGYLGWFLQQFIVQESPEVVVIGGNIANAYDLFKDDLITKISENGMQLPKIAQAALGEHALLIGGACCFQQIQDNKIPVSAS